MNNHTPKPHPLASAMRKTKGFGLIQTMLVLGAISVMGLATYAVLKPTSASAQVKAEQDNLRHLSRAVDRSFGLLGSFDRVSTAKVIDDDLAPRRMRQGGGLQTQWGAPVSVDPYTVHQPGDAFVVAYPAASAEVCASLASAMGRDAFDIRVNGSSVYDLDGMSPNLAAERCAAGNSIMEFVFHSGLVSGQAVAAPPLILPPAPPSTSRPPSTPPVMDIPDNPDVGDATPGAIPTPPADSAPPPPAPPPVAPPPAAPEPEPVVITPPPPVPPTPPGSICQPPATWTETQARTTVTCPAGSYGTRDEQRGRPVSYTCPEAWDNPVESRGAWSAWSVASSNCTTCPTLAPEAQTRWVSIEGSCPSGQLGQVSHQAEERRTRSRSYNCPYGTETLPSVSLGSWSSWDRTGNTRNSVNTCADECVLPNPSTQSQRETRTGNRTRNCPAGQVGEIRESRPEERTRTRTATCPSPTGSPVWGSWSAWSSWAGTGSWTVVSNTCATQCVLPNPSTQTQTETRTATRKVNCPALLQTGEITESRPEQRKGTRTASCPASATAPVWSAWSWSDWTGTGPWVETSNTCEIGGLFQCECSGSMYAGSGYVDSFGTFRNMTDCEAVRAGNSNQVCVNETTRFPKPTHAVCIHLMPANWINAPKALECKSM